MINIGQILRGVNEAPDILREIRDEQRETNQLLRTLKGAIEKFMEAVKDLQDEITSLTSSVTTLTTVEASVEAAFQGLSNTNKDLLARLEAAIAANDPAAIQSAVAGLKTQHQLIDASIAKFSAAIVANTPAAPAPAIT